MAKALSSCSKFSLPVERCTFHRCVHRSQFKDRLLQRSQRRFLQTVNRPNQSPDFAFVFDIDGVLVRGKKPLPQAFKTLSTLRQHEVPFLLLTNGGGYAEEQRAADLSEQIGLKIHTSEIIQSHTPFQDMQGYMNGTALIVGGEYDKARNVARKYGFLNAVTPSDIFKQDPSIWPFSRPLHSYHDVQKPPSPLPPIDPKNLSKGLKIDSIFVYNDPRDWGLDMAVIIDILLSHRGYVGTLSGKNGLAELPNNGYQQDGQPPLFFSNPDLWFAADYHLPRFGQGAFRAAIEGVWKDVSGGAALEKRVFGKPNQETYEYAERKLLQSNAGRETPLRDVYMVGDNPDSDIRGAMGYKSPKGINWHGALVRSGIYTGGKPSVKPTTIVEDVWEAVQWGVKSSGR